MRPHAVLSVGTDPLLIETRESILTRAGYSVTNVATVRAAITLMIERPFVLAIICHTIDEQGRRDIIFAAKAQRPPIKTLVVRVKGDTSRELADDTVVGLDGPDELLSAVADLLHK